MGAVNAYSVWNEYRNDQINTDKFLMEQTSNVYATFGGPTGAAWSIGWEAGRAVTNTEWYQETKFNLFYDLWERKYGKPSSSNEWIWNYFYQNYKP